MLHNFTMTYVSMNWFYLSYLVAFFFENPYVPPFWKIPNYYFFKLFLLLLPPFFCSISPQALTDAS